MNQTCKNYCEEKKKIFSDLNNFPKTAYASHFANSRWGGKPKEIIK